VAADPSPRVQFWLAIPGGSRMRLSVSGTTAQNVVTATVFVVRDDSMNQTFLDPAVQPGPLLLNFLSNHAYSIETDLVFGNDASAKVTAEVSDPDGAAIAPKFESIVPGTAGHMLPVRLFVSTVA